nr:Drug resistance transporter, EmrB/QacA subfamily [Mycobacterium pseudoshottsii]
MWWPCGRTAQRSRVAHSSKGGGTPRPPALLISRLVSWVDDLWCRAIGAGV